GYPVLGGEKTEIEILSGAKQRTVVEMGVTETEWGEQSAYLATLRDITERKQAEELLGSYFTVSPDLLSIAGFDGYFKKLSQSWQETLGYSMEELLSKPWLDFVHPDDTQATIGAGNQLFEGKKVVKFENRYRTKDGQYRWIEWHCTPLIEDKRIYCVARDITEPKRAVEEIQRRTMELESANKELEAFTYSAAHDLRSPLIAVGGLARVLVEKHSHEFEVREKEILRVIEKEIGRMRQLVDDLLSFSRFGRQALEASEIDMNQLAQSVIDDLNLYKAREALELNLRALPPACGDPAMIRQVFMNLLSNAFKFTRPKARGIIEIGGKVEDGMNTYYVKDNGVGFDMADVNKLFEVFKRLHSSEEFEGTGIGLAIVKRIVERHSGRVWAEGKIAEGATFYFSLRSECPIRSS
ncbi:MAG TPA: PAS domain S-box protein, partial [Desulfatiglandales bacterium]|nr:PAS domain S-box protein [Desulfatiglandales bacterium]